MDAQEFTHHLAALDREQIRLVAARLDAQLGTAAGEIDWWETTLGIQRSLRLHCASRTAERAAHHAIAVVQAAAQRAGYELPDEHVTRIARAAADVVRGLVAGSDAWSATNRLLVPWEPVLPAAAPAA